MGAFEEAVIWDAWGTVWYRIPEEDRPLISGLRIVRQEDLANIFSYQTPCAEADQYGGWVIFAANGPCVTNRQYVEDVLAHEAGHIVAFKRQGDNSERAADQYGQRVMGRRPMWGIREA